MRRRIYSPCGGHSQRLGASAESRLPAATPGAHAAELAAGPRRACRRAGVVPVSFLVECGTTGRALGVDCHVLAGPARCASRSSSNSSIGAVVSVGPPSSRMVRRTAASSCSSLSTTSLSRMVPKPNGQHEARKPRKRSKRTLRTLTAARGFEPSFPGNSASVRTPAVKSKDCELLQRAATVYACAHSL